MTPDKPLLLLFDGHALIHRAFHALSGLSTKGGQPIGAVYGFTSMVLKTLDEFKPSYCAVSFDSAAPTFRHVQFAEYKAHRPKAPDELISQFGLVRELVQTLNIPAFEIDGYEADDILGTLCTQAETLDINTIIVTGDTDILQLASPNVRILLPRPRRPFSDTQLYDEAAVQERYGLKPKQLTDLKGLMGDSSDNVPGVPGIGEKTASKLLKEFNTIEEIYQQLDKVTPPKLREKLQTNEEAARQSKELVTIVTDVPLSLDLPACHIHDYDREKVVELFRTLEFYSLLDKLPGLPTAEAQPAITTKEISSTDYRIVNTTEALDELVKGLSSAKAVAIDTETTSTNSRHASLVGISLSANEGKAWYIPVGHKGDGSQLSLSQVSDKLHRIFADPKIGKTAHNAKYDLAVLSRHGLEVRNIDFDTMIAAHLLGEKALGLKQLTFSRLGIEMTPISTLIGSGAKQISMADVSTVQAAEYACADADMTGRLSRLFAPEMKDYGLWDLFADVEMPLMPILYQMETNGIALNSGLLEEMSQELTQEIGKIESEIYTWVGHEFKINSSQQLG
ncbi:MAG: DNA polymerase I, partial [Chloroflexi bacterium]|nr:DNA polymerase I [Chloroflexota bacterium]